MININYLIYVIVLTLFLNLNNKLINACPSDFCICKWKGGKQTVECGGQLLSKIPEGMDPGTQVLNFSGNSLQVLQSERFLRMDLINLQKIYISRNQLIKIHEKAFRGLSNLVELDLSDNMLQHIPSATFQDYTSLMRLTLNGNPIRQLKSGSFRYLAFLTTLELSNCQIEIIEDESFIGMDNLEWLRLDGNRIINIKGNHILPKSLHGISLHSNRWLCDCNLIDIHTWLINYNIPQIDEPKCIEPIRMKGKIIKNLKNNDLACEPEIKPKSTYMEVSEGRNISLICNINAIPEAKIFWLFNGQLLNNDTINDNLHLYWYIDIINNNNNNEKKSELFIYNTGIEDNGTFSCIAKNIAGISYSNYTLRILIKEQPIVNEVSFPKNYLNIIIASGSGISIILFILIFTIFVKCIKKKSNNNNNNINNKSDTNINNSDSILKCPSIINEEELSPKMNKENGILLNNQLKHNILMYIPTIQQQQQQQQHQQLDQHQQQVHNMIDNSNMQLHQTNTFNNSIDIPVQYINSPQLTLRNYQDKNPDLINDAESVKNKYKLNNDYEQNGIKQQQLEQNGHYSLDNCYQLSQQQFGSQILRPIQQQQQQLHPQQNLNQMQCNNLLVKFNNGQQQQQQHQQHQVDIHLNPIRFLNSNNFGYDFSSNHVHQTSSTINNNKNQHNFYRTLPHNRVNNKKLMYGKYKTTAMTAAAETTTTTTSTTNTTSSTPTIIPTSTSTNSNFYGDIGNYGGIRYSLEAELLQQQNFNDFNINNMRFTAEGYPIYQKQFPSPPDGYKSDFIINETGHTICPSTSFQQWPTCLPGYHIQAIKYPKIITNENNLINKISNNTNNLNDIQKKCTSAQTIDISDPSSTIHEENYNDDENNDKTKNLRHLTGPLADSPDEGYVGDSQEGSDI